MGSYENIFAEMEERSGKIPIKIEGWNNFALLGGVEKFLFGTFNFYGCGISLEESIQDVIDWLRLNSKIYLERMALGEENKDCDNIPGQYQDIAFRLLNHKGRLESLFFLEYTAHDKEKIEPQLGRFARLERIVK